MRVYVAGSSQQVERVQVAQATVLEAGGEVTYDWTRIEGNLLGGSSWDAVPERARAIAEAEVEAAATADLVVLLVPPAPLGLGCWVEMGAALAAGVPVWLVDGDRDSVFAHHPLVRRLSFDELAGALADAEPLARA